MRAIYLSFLFLVSMTTDVWAEKIRGRIDTIDFGNQDEQHLLKLTDGQVVFVDPESGLLNEKEIYSHLPVELDIDENRTVRSIATLPEEELPLEDEDEVISEEVHLDQTDLPSLSEAQRIFRGMNNSWKSNTECTDRAHVWTYEEFKKNNLISRKVFMFFTNTYIRKYRYHWWFHVSPYVLVNGDVRVMDRRYTGGPRTMKAWTDVFIKSKKTCPENTYRYYRANKNGPEHCILVKADMYYRLPYHVRMLEDYGRRKTQFSQSEVNFSYRAFNRRGAK